MGAAYTLAESGWDDVTIKNGIITGFERGIRLKNGTGLVVKDIEAHSNDFSALRIRDNAEVKVDNVYFHDNFDDSMGVSTGLSIITPPPPKKHYGCISILW